MDLDRWENEGGTPMKQLQSTVIEIQREYTRAEHERAMRTITDLTAALIEIRNGPLTVERAQEIADRAL